MAEVCPICKSKVKDEDIRVDTIANNVSEYCWSCSDENHEYTYEYVTGSEREIINGVEIYHRRDNAEFVKRARENLIELAQIYLYKKRRTKIREAAVKQLTLAARMKKHRES
ncbi:zinc DNA binding domain protein [Bacillus phage 015DV002]|nr:zinc DNA binding domain protein [Bacillus phage 015DV002]